MAQPNFLVFVTGDFKPTTTGLDLKDLNQPNNLKQMFNFNTSRDSNILDWVLTIFTTTKDCKKGPLHSLSKTNN